MIYQGEADKGTIFVESEPSSPSTPSMSSDGITTILSRNPADMQPHASG
jgi:hypothetical protein